MLRKKGVGSTQSSQKKNVDNSTREFKFQTRDVKFWAVHSSSACIIDAKSLRLPSQPRCGARGAVKHLFERLSSHLSSKNQTSRWNTSSQTSARASTLKSPRSAFTSRRNLRYGSTRNTKWMILIFLRLKWVTLSGCIECLDAVNVTLIYRAEGVVL